MEEQCTFCNIINRKDIGFKIYEDERHLAFLDIYPNTKGQTLVVTKEHISSDFLNISNEKFLPLLAVSKEVANLIKRSLSALRVFLVIEGMEINHIHVKLYPIYKIRTEAQQNMSNDMIYFNEYKGYLTTLHGPKANYEELKKIASIINSGT